MAQPKKKILAIINPISGIRPKNNLPDLIRENINPELFDIDIALTEYAGHATLLARNAVEKNTDYVLAIGGDGTINETAKALIHTKTALGIVPLGSGNGLARHLQIPLEITKSLKVINEEHVIQLDYCTANDHIFFCTAGLGFDALISKKFSEDKHRGGITYLKNVLTEYLSYEPHSYQIITHGGKVVEKAFLIACGNASQYGNNAYIAPGANMQDGLMDITVIKPFNHLEAPQLAIQLFTKQLAKNSKIEILQDSAIKIILEKPEVMHVDGEPIMMDKEIEVKTIARGLNILTPANPTHSIIDPVKHAFEEVHYNLVYDIKEVFRKPSLTFRK